MTRNGCLDEIAVDWAEHMARAGRVESNPRYISGAAACLSGWTMILENVRSGPTVDAVMTGMMRDPQSASNVLAGTVTDIGVGVWADGAGVLWVSVVYVADG